MSPAARRARHTLIVALLIFLGLAGILFYVGTKSARLVSGALTDALGQPVSVSLVGFSPASGLTLYGLTIKNPDGYKSPYLLNIKSMGIMPVYGALIQGRLTFRSLGVFSPALHLEKDSSGRWNFQPMMDKLKKGKPHKFTISVTRVVSGRISLVDQGVTLSIPEVWLGALSSANPAPTPFTALAKDDKGSEVTCQGEAGIMTSSKSIIARLAFKGDKLWQYFTPPNGLDFHGSSLNAALDFSFADGRADARLDGTLSGVHSEYFKEKKGLSANFKAEAGYALDAGSLEIRSANLDVPGVAGMTMIGNLKDVTRDPAIDLKVTASPVELARLGPYLPAGMKAQGVLRPGTISVKGKLKPLSVSASGGLDVADTGISYRGVEVKGINGKGSVSVYPKGTADATFSLSVPGGTLSGSGAYTAGTGTFNLKCRGLDISRLGPVAKGLQGKLDAEATGSLGQPRGAVRADFKVNGSGIGMKDAGFSAGGVAVSGIASTQGKRLSVTGTISGEKALLKGRMIDSIKAGFSWMPGKAALSELSLKAKDFDVSARSLSATYSGRSARALLSGLAASYGKDASVKDVEVSIAAEMPGGGGQARADGAFKLPSGEVWGASLSGFIGSFRYGDKGTGLEASGEVLGNPVTLSAGGAITATQGLKNPYLSGKITVTHMESLTPLLTKRGMSLSFAGGALSAMVSLKGGDIDSLSGSALLKADGLGLNRNGRPLLRDLSFELKPVYKDSALELPSSRVSFGGSFGVDISGTAARNPEGWSGRLTAKLPETGLTSLQEGVLDLLPPTLKWSDVGGRASLDTGLSLRLPAKGGAASGDVTGTLTLKGATLSIPDQKIVVGPADGVLPISYSFGGRGGRSAPAMFRQEQFEREIFDQLIKKYSQRPAGVNLVIQKAAFGLFEADDIELALVPGDGWYQVDWLGLKGFGANVYGYALADFTKPKARYSLSLLMSGFSLAELCRTVPGISGHLSGKVAGMVRVYAGGTGYEGIAGAASFWAYKGPHENMVISKEFLKRLMGKSKSYMLMGDRSFDKGELDAIFSGGYIVFDNLLIEHTNFLGRQDLKVSVAPVSNKVSIEHLIEVMKDVSERAATMK